MEHILKYMEEGQSVFNSRADADIERNRKGDFELIFPDGVNVDARIELERIDFNFGANIFMLGEYDIEEQNHRYEELFCKIFNSAAIPLYWEGTEPKEGYLRYDADTPHDVYRRPPVKYVMDFCKKNNIRMKGHPLFWHEFVPAWLPKSYKDLKPLIVKRFEEISKFCKDDVEAFDVVNEVYKVIDVYMRDRKSFRPYILPDDDYCIWLFDLANRYFPANKLIINDTVGATFGDFKGKYGAYYLNIKDLINRGARIDEIGMQCHIGEAGLENVYNAERLYFILDTYASLGKTLNISEISIPSVYGGEKNEELQARLVEQLYKVCFSHKNMTGITWWNLPDDGILITKRVAEGENLPSTGLVDGDYSPKLAYKVLDRLINQEWTTKLEASATSGSIKFRGFYGEYVLDLKYNRNSVKKKVKFTKDSPSVICMDI